MEGSQFTWFWFIAGIVLLLAELALPGGVVVFLGAGALLVAAASYLDFIEGWVQASILWCIVSPALLFGLRGVTQKLMPAEQERGQTDEDADAQGAIAYVQERIPLNGQGRIQFRGTTWIAKNSRHNRDLEPGEAVRIVARDNLIWIVEAVEADEPGRLTLGAAE